MDCYHAAATIIITTRRLHDVLICVRRGGVVVLVVVVEEKGSRQVRRNEEDDVKAKIDDDGPIRSALTSPIECSWCQTSTGPPSSCRDDNLTICRAKKWSSLTSGGQKMTKISTMPPLESRRRDLSIGGGIIIHDNQQY